jgi:catechol 2,3-dioxygenase-like lactoylglutathione lyase family enzyme
MATTVWEPEVSMISGAHVVIHTKDAEADRAFFRDVLQFPFVDAGHGWLIFAMPPLEVAFMTRKNRIRRKMHPRAGRRRAKANTSFF